MIGNLDDREFSEAVERIIKEVNQVVSDLDTAIRSQAFAVLSPYVFGSATAYLSQGLSVDPNELVMRVLRESYLETQEDLRQYAEKVEANERNKELREKELRELVRDGRDRRSDDHGSAVHAHVRSVGCFGR